MALDRETIEDTVKTHYREVYGYCCARLIDKSAAEDVVQEVFLLLQAKSAELEPDNLRAWLYSVAQKKLLETKRDAYRRSRFVEYEEGIEVMDPALVYEFRDNEIEDGEIERIKRRILTALSPQEQALFEEIYEKHAQRTVLAQQMDISLNTLNVRLHRMRKHIREMAEVAWMILIFAAVKMR